MSKPALVESGNQGLMARLSESPNYLLVLMFLVSVFNILDRQILSILQEEIKLDLSLTDSQIGMLALTFGIFQALMAVPIGRMADTQYPRKAVLSACLGVWSLATTLCGFAQNFAQLMLARLGVGGGTAGFAPTAFSLISDKVPVKRRSFAIALCMSGTTLGMALSLAAGGVLADTVGWRMTFIIAGIPGLILVPLLIYTVRAPERGHADGLTEQSNGIGFMPSLKRLMMTKSFVFVVAGGAIKAIAFNGIIQWIPAFYMRKFDLSMGEVGTTLGPIIGVFMLISMLVSSYIADRLGERDLRWHPWIISVTLLLNFPFIYFALVVDSYYLSLVFYALATLMGAAMMGINNSMIQNAAPVQMRGTATAIKTLALGLLGWGVGGALIGILSDLFGAEGSAEGLQTALVLVSIGLPVASLSFFLSSGSYTSDCESAREL
ncbi:MFS transporter [Pseudomaricurvus alkylphenolicus]|uniref:spinster family MFS transporter n=1 Tax=Pseudomaricurvus alkylphenolicus TaxID=1306991 RepID=UPI0014201237|nr:MFS transporter [Pseudomaricurvus alkylphenolicus]NIB41581.1 MFS transporter [Pseudomaricurvus alkylphenolicus]